MNPNSTAEVLKRGKYFLKSAGIDSWSLDAELLLMECTGLTRVRLFTEPREPVEETACRAYEQYLKRRAGMEPVQYILKRCEFMSLEFYVDESVLIPRPDTEILVESAIKKIKERGYRDILEIGTGSGCISVSLAYYLEKVNITACDISEPALETARRNAIENRVSDRIEFVHKDCLELLRYPDRIFDIIVSNPPYIPSDEIEALGLNVKNFEPKGALDGGSEGLDFYRAIARGMRELVKPGGAVICEIGWDQAEPIVELMKNTGIEKVEIIRDLSGLNRVIIVDVD